MKLGTGVIGGKLPSVVYTNSYAYNSNIATTHNYTSVPFSAAASSRLLVARFYVLVSSGNAPNACTMGGVTATLVRQSSATGSAFSQLWSAPVPTGTSGTISLTRNANMLNSAVTLWAVYDLKSMTAHDTAYGSFGHPITASVNVPSNGVVIGALTVGSLSTLTWSGLGEDFDQQYGPSGTTRISGASASRLPAASPLNVTVTSAGGTSGNMILASFR